MLLYWAENVIIGFYNILKIALLKVETPILNLSKLFMIPFFCIHFGAFCAVHGFLLLIFFKLGGAEPLSHLNMSWGPLIFIQLFISVIVQLWQNRPAGMEWPVIALFISHGISFMQNYVAKKEYGLVSLAMLMNQPYKRIVLLHIAIIAGGVPVMMLGSPTPLLVILIGLKIGMDIWLHTQSHSLSPIPNVE